VGRCKVEGEGEEWRKKKLEVAIGDKSVLIELAERRGD
jgi:hypothetical protein